MEKSSHQDNLKNSASKSQKKRLLQLMKQQGNAAIRPDTSEETKRFWEAVAEELNALEGATKQANQWKNVWFDWKCDVVSNWTQFTYAGIKNNETLKAEEIADKMNPMDKELYKYFFDCQEEEIAHVSSENENIKEIEDFDLTIEDVKKRNDSALSINSDYIKTDQNIEQENETGNKKRQSLSSLTDAQRDTDENSSGFDSTDTIQSPEPPLDCKLEKTNVKINDQQMLDNMQKMEERLMILAARKPRFIQTNPETTEEIDEDTVTDDDGSSNESSTEEVTPSLQEHCKEAMRMMEEFRSGFRIHNDKLNNMVEALRNAY